LTHPTPAELESFAPKCVAFAEEAGALLKRGWGAKPTYRTKSSEIDLVTEFDEGAEKILVERLTAAFPQHALVGEEGARIGAADPSTPTWYIDPLDGTANFAHGVPNFSVSLGLVVDTVPLLGIVHAPALNQTFVGGPGIGTKLNGQKLAVSTVETVHASMLATGFPSKPGLAHDNLAEFQALTGRVHGIRRFGSAALDLAFVAAGWFDGFWERDISPWDLSGGAALVLGAGGTVTDIDGGRYDGCSGRCLATNGRIHGQLQAELEQVARTQGTPWP